MIKTYLLLTKPGIILGNIVATLGGFLLASRGTVNSGLFLATLTGLGMVIASSCVFNNFIDQGIDKKMTRTRNRALAKKLISGRNAIAYAALLGIVGFLILLRYTNLLTVAIAFGGFFFYVVMYSFWKRYSEYGTLVGSISGAVPPVVGYCAVTNKMDIGAVLLFVILILWQMPHFYAIAIFRKDEYAAASLPVLPVVRGIYVAKIHILLYISAYIIALPLLTIFGYASHIYLVVMAFFSLYWLGVGLKGLQAHDNIKWARRMFGFSLVNLMVFSFMLSVDVWFK